MIETLPWSDTNRYSQTGYSSPTVWPTAGNYASLELWAIDYDRALRREQSHQDWLDEERYYAHEEWAEYQAEVKAEREQNDY